MRLVDVVFIVFIRIDLVFVLCAVLLGARLGWLSDFFLSAWTKSDRNGIKRFPTFFCTLSSHIKTLL